MAAKPEIHVGDHGDTVTIKTGPKSNLGDSASGLAVWAEFTQPTKALAAVLLDDGGVFTDITDEAKDADAADAGLLPLPPSIDVDDAIYFMGTYRFGTLFFTLPTVGVGSWALTWEYLNDSDVWTALTVVDDTNDFTDNTPSDFELPAVTFDIPSDWKKTTVNGVGPYWAIRARVTTGDPSANTQPVATQVRLGPVQVSGTITDTTNGKFQVTIPKGLFDQDGTYRVQARRETASPSSLIRGLVAEFSVKRRGDR